MAYLGMIEQRTTELLQQYQQQQQELDDAEPERDRTDGTGKSTTDDAQAPASAPEQGGAGVVLPSAVPVGDASDDEAEQPVRAPRARRSWLVRPLMRADLHGGRCTRRQEVAPLCAAGGDG